MIELNSGRKRDERQMWKNLKEKSMSFMLFISTKTNGKMDTINDPESHSLYSYLVV